MKPILFCSLLACTCLFASEVTQRQIDAPAPGINIWPNRPPENCPFPQSDTFSAVLFTGRHAEYTGADTWYPSWAADGDLYSPWTDGNVNGLGSHSGGKNATTGSARITGVDPMNLKVVDQSIFASDPSPYAGRYPCGSLFFQGTWYYGTYTLHPSGSVKHTDGVTYNWPWLGPFVGFRTSTDKGKTWTQTPCTPATPLFGETALKGEPVKVGSPHFVDFGKGLQHSPDGKAYLAGHGASDGGNRRFGYNSWITGDEIYLARVSPSLENMNDVSKYEFFAGNDASGKEIWTSDFSKIKPTAAWKDNMGCVTVTYNAPLKKYFMCVTDGGNTVSRYNTYILEADRLGGPWKRVIYMKHFGEQAYFVNIPSKFISADGRTMWLCYAANFSNGWNGVRLRSWPEGSRYGMCLQEIKLVDVDKEKERLASPLSHHSNVAPLATVSVTSQLPNHEAERVVDRRVGGFPDHSLSEWASEREANTAMVRLDWNSPQTINRVWLFDRPNEKDQVTSGMLVFSDGSTIQTESLPNDASKGLEIAFPPKKVNWMAFIITDVKPSTLNIGLSEIAVFDDSAK